jgi:DNA-binding NarL/FixJ family response regulator
MIKILIADDHSLVREGVKQIAALATDIVVAGEAVNGWDALEKLQKTACHVLLLDISMPGINGIDLIRRVKEDRPLLPILILSMYSEGHLAARAIKAGASGYVTKDSEPETLIAAIRKVAGGGRYVEPRLAEQMALEFSLADDRPPHETLSEREFQVLEKVLAGQHINQIALDLSLSAKTVSTHKARLMRKLNIQSNAELIRYGLKHRLFEAGEATARPM